MSRAFTGTVPETLWLELDSNAGTQIIKDGGTASREHNAFLEWDVTATAYTLPGRHASAFVIGGGGGRDVLTALRFGASRVDVVEINPAVIEASRDVFGAYGGGIYTRPEVHLTIGNARTVLARSPARYDVIQMSMIDTWAASMAGQLVLTENTLYTREAFDGVPLAPLGRRHPQHLALVRHATSSARSSRVLALMGDALEHRGRREPAADHVALLYTKGYLGHAVASCMMKRSAVHARRGRRARRAQSEKAVHAALADGARRRRRTRALDPTRTIARDPALMRDGPFDLRPPTDERPFFFATRKPLRELRAARSRSGGSRAGARRASSSCRCSCSCSGSARCSCSVRCAATRALAARGARSRTARPSSYFAGIGTGFMLIELALIQRYIVFLGSPHVRPVGRAVLAAALHRRRELA